VERLADPLGLVAKGSVWYLVAAVDGEVRSYRVSRVRGARITGEPCVRPDGFDLAAWWTRSASLFKESLPCYPAILRVHPEILPRLRYAGRFARIGKVEPPDPDGWSRVEVRFQMEEEAAEYVLSFGPRIEALDPLALRERVVRMAEEVVAFYAVHRRSVPRFERYLGLKLPDPGTVG
jgi:predicted DNA-binding transcriptional regulator YafY